MNKVNVKDHPILIQYRDTMTRILNSKYPLMNKNDIEKAVEFSIQKRFKDFNLSIQNKYTGKTVDMAALAMLDYIRNREPIITSYGTMFRRHNTIPNPMGKVIDDFLKLRKMHKKEMFKYPKGSEQFEKFNLLQALDKIDVNGIYGLIGLYVSILFDLNIAPAVTSTGRSLISSAILCFEGFLGNNVKFSSLNDILIFIDNVRLEYSSWQYNDYEILPTEGFVSLEEAFTKLILNCGYKYIPSYEDMDTVYRILQSCNQIELNRLFYKNNLYCFMDLPIARNLMISIITNMQTPYIEPAKPPKEIVPQLNKLRDLLVEYVFYNHQWMDRMDRNKNMIKNVSIVSDTDSSFVSLDAWYQYNMAYLKDYDSPILHQKIDLFMKLEKEKKSDYWKNKEIPEWYNAINKTEVVEFLDTDEFGDLKDPSRLNGIEFLDNEKDYDFYNQEIIEKKRLIDALEIIPQDNLKFALINIMCYILSTIINLYMIDFTKQSGSYRSDELCRINMKNEFMMSRIMLTAVKKNYASLQILQEGNYLGKGVLDCKGIPCLTKSSTSKDTQKALRKILLEDIITGKVDQLKLIKDIAILEKTIYNDLKSGSKKYYKPAIIKSMDSYETPLRIQGVKAAIAWNYVRTGLPGFDLTNRNSLDIVKIKIDKNSAIKIRDQYPEQYEKFCDILESKSNIQLEGFNLHEIFGGKLENIAIPKDTPIPDWLIPFIDYDAIINDNLSNFPVESCGIGSFGNKKVNYNNVVKL